MENRVNLNADPEKGRLINLLLSGLPNKHLPSVSLPLLNGRTDTSINVCPGGVGGQSPPPGPHQGGISCGASAPGAATECARELSSDQAALSERTACQPKTDPSSISCVTDRWGTPQGREVLKKSSFSIPGSGEITDPEQCGNWFKVAACSVVPEHYKKKITHSCGHIVCPTCWRDPVYKAAKTASGRIRGFIADAINKKLHCDSYSELVLNHYVLSAPAGLIMPDMPYNQIKQKGRDIATTAGIWGGFMAFHPWRLKKRIIQRLSTLCIEHANMGEEEREKRFWEMVRDDALQLGSWRKYILWSPHFHAIGFGRLPDQNTEEEKEMVKKLYKGWAVVWIRHVETFHQFTGQRLADPVADLAAYILSHAGYQENKKMPVWLGELSQNKMYVKEIIKQEYSVICPKCQADVVMGQEEMGIWVPDINSMTGKMIPQILKNREFIYIIGKNPNCKRKRSRREKIWHDVVPDGITFQQQCEAARLDRLKMGIT